MEKVRINSKIKVRYRDTYSPFKYKVVGLETTEVLVEVEKPYKEIEGWKGKQWGRKAGKIPIKEEQLYWWIPKDMILEVFNSGFELE